MYPEAASAEHLSPTSVCGDPLPRLPSIQQKAYAAWTTNPQDGPIFGERIEEYHPGDLARLRTAESSVRSKPPCPVTSTGGDHLHALPLAAPTVGTHGSAVVIQDPSRPKGWRYVYQVGAQLGSRYLVLFSLGVRQPDTGLLDKLVEDGYRKAAEHLGH